MIRTWIKTGAAGVLSRTGMDRMLGSLAGRTPLVIGYHRVVEDFASSAQTSIPSMLISRRMLEQQLDWIGRRFQFVSLDELGARLESNSGLEKPMVAITFDDGYRDFYDLALPLLKKKGIPATLFVVTDLVGTTRVQVHDKLYLLLAKRYEATRKLIEGLSQAEVERVIARLEAEIPIPEGTYRPFYSLTWDGLAAILRAGMSVGSHTRTHVLMTNEDGPRRMEEAAGSRQELEGRLGIRIRHFAYPSGQFNTASVNAVAAAGYRFAYTTCSHRDARHPLLTVPRTLFWENSCRDPRGRFSASILTCQANRAFDLVGGCHQRHATKETSGHDQL